MKGTLRLGKQEAVLPSLPEVDALWVLANLGRDLPEDGTLGSKYPIFEVSDPKGHTPNAIWGQNPQILGTWTFQGTAVSKEVTVSGCHK